MTPDDFPAGKLRHERFVLIPGKSHGSDLKMVKVPFDLPGFGIFQSWHPRLKSDKGHIWLRGLIQDQVGQTG